LDNNVFRSSGQQYQYLITEKRREEIRKFVREIVQRMRAANKARTIGEQSGL